MKQKPKLAKAGEGSLSYTIRDCHIYGVGERAHVSVGSWYVRRASDAPRHDSREVRSAARGAGHRAAAVALTRVFAVRRAGAQHRRVHREIIRLERAVARAEGHDAHRRVEQRTGSVSCAQT